MSEPTETQLNAVREIYADLAARPVHRNCTLLTECCRFKLTGLIPHMTRGEALVAARALRAAGRKKLPEPADGACPLLDPRTARCIIYKDRPFACRTHFCKAAGGPYERREVLDLIRKLEEIDARLAGCGAQTLPTAMAHALRDTA